MKKKNASAVMVLLSMGTSVQNSGCQLELGNGKCLRSECAAAGHRLEDSQGLPRRLGRSYALIFAWLFRSDVAGSADFVYVQAGGAEFGDLTAVAGRERDAD